MGYLQGYTLITVLALIADGSVFFVARFALCSEGRVNRIMRTQERGCAPATRFD